MSSRSGIQYSANLNFTGMERRKVAVIGAGCLGIVTLKNLLEEGFEAIAFERNSHVGGMWHFNENKNQTSGTQSTQWNGSQQMSAYTDFPFPSNAPDHPNLLQIADYLQAYCQHFALYDHMKLGCETKSVKRTEDDRRWVVEYFDQDGRKQEELFDRVAIASGQASRRYIPHNIEGLENFKGKVIHAQAYKRPSEFEDKTVLVLGSSNTAMDTVIDLNGHAKKIYLSHRSGGIIIPRIHKGVPFEWNLTTRLLAMAKYGSSINPAFFGNLMTKRRIEMSEDTFGKLPSEWRFNIPYKDRRQNPIINDKIVEVLRQGNIPIVHAMRRILTSGAIELADGTTLSDIDSIILCTGYEYDFSLVPESLNPNRNQNPSWLAARNSGNKPHPTLYRGFISLDYPDSLVYIGACGFIAGQMPLWDLASMALAQMWKGAYPTPSLAEMQAEVNERRAWLIEFAKRPGPQVLFNEVNPITFLEWCHEVAGTGVNENLGYGLSGWWFWMTNRRLCNALMSSMPCPHIWRLFDGRRKKWNGAEEAVLELNAIADARRKAYQRGSLKKDE